MTYTYDGGGRRASKVGSKLYWYGSGGEILAETDASERFNWHVISIEDARLVTDDEEFEDEQMEDMIARTRTNPKAIILGTFHGYKVN